jgi:hypothetical protein
MSAFGFMLLRMDSEGFDPSVPKMAAGLLDPRQTSAGVW